MEISTTRHECGGGHSTCGGAALADVRGGPPLDAAVVRLEERRLRVTGAWIDAQLALGAHAEL